jgi:hypothetical protein
MVTRFWLGNSTKNIDFDSNAVDSADQWTPANDKDNPSWASFSSKDSRRLLFAYQ